jgi:hypothetical protein
VDYIFNPKRVQGHYILSDDGEPVPEPDLMKWARWFETTRFWRLAFDQISEYVVVSTIFLGLDHRFGGDGPPILWETMVFKNGEAQDMIRYSSRAAAMEGHEKLVAEWRANVKWHTFG